MDIDGTISDFRKRIFALETGGALPESQSVMKDEAVKSAIQAYREAATQYEEQRALMAAFMEKWTPLLEQLAQAKEEYEVSQRELAEQEAANRGSEDSRDENKDADEEDASKGKKGK